jgi:hypothetical protein
VIEALIDSYVRMVRKKSCMSFKMNNSNNMKTKKLTKGTTMLLLVVVAWCTSSIISQRRVTIFADATGELMLNENQKHMTLQEISRRQQPQQHYPSDSAVIEVIETEVWDACSNSWKGQHENRWTNVKGHVSPSPSEIQAPEGWDFSGDWKILISNNQQEAGGGAEGGALGWDYQFQYLRPPIRKRTWLRSLNEEKPIPRPPMSETLSRNMPSFSARRSVLQRVQDNWNFKGYGMSLYKSFVFRSSCGIGLRLPLTVNFDFFDSRPEWPSVTCGTALFFPWTIMGFLSATVRIEWVKWVIQCALALIPRIVLWVLYKVALPLILATTTAFLFPFRHRIPSIPTTIPRGFWTIAKPRYNAEVSECIGCSLSFRWSQARGSEFRIIYSHSYLPTFSVYRQLISQTREQLSTLKSTLTERKRRIKETEVAGSQRSGSIDASNTNDWWQKHFARLGVGTGYPIPNPPFFSCSAILSLSGLYFGSNNRPFPRTTPNPADECVTNIAAPCHVKDKKDCRKETPPATAPAGKSQEVATKVLAEV